MTSDDIALLQEYLARWNITAEGEAFSSNNTLLQAGFYQDQPVMLKILPFDSDEIRAAEMLTYCVGTGMVRCLAYEEHALLLERIIPATPLSALVQAGKDRQATLIFCDMVTQLHSYSVESEFPPPTPYPVAHLSASFTQYFSCNSASSSIYLGIDHSLVSEAYALYRHLCGTQTSPTFLHGDLHHDNILWSNKRGWLAIDPKCYFGEVAFEVATMLRNPVQYPDHFCSKQRFLERLTICSERLNLPKERIGGWAFSTAILATLWAREDNNPNAAIWHNFAKTLSSMRLY